MQTLKALGGLAFILVVLFILATPAVSPIYAYRTQAKVKRLCSSVRKGDVFDLAAFKTRASAAGMHASEWSDGNTVSVMETYFLMSSAICYVDLSKGVVTGTRTILHSP